jgi:cell division protein FtsB
MKMKDNSKETFIMEQAHSTSCRKYSESYRVYGITPEEYRVLHPRRKVKWRFKPRSFWTFFTWGLALFLVCRIVLFPFIEGICNYLSKDRELSKLRVKYAEMNRQMASLKKNRAYMQQPSYILERGHQIGMIKPNEAQYVVVEPDRSASGEKTAPKRE